MRSHSFRFVVPAVLVLTALASAAPGQDAALRYRFTKGETIRYRATQAVNVSMDNVPGAGSMTVDTNIVQVQSMNVTDVASDGTATVRVTFDSVKMDMTSPMGTMSYDSAAPAQSAGNPMAEMIAKSYGAIVGGSVTMVVTPSGEIKSINGLDALAQKISAGLPQGAGLPGMSSLMTEDSLRTALEQNFPAVPNRSVRAGETWTHNKSVKTGLGTAQTAMTFTFKGVESRAGRQLATLAVAGTSKVTTDAAAAAGMPMQMTMGEGTSQGELTLDTKTGRLYRSSVQSTQPMSMSMTGADGAAMTMGAVTKTTLTVELIEK
jgi:hypothetical protein